MHGVNANSETPVSDENKTAILLPNLNVDMARELHNKSKPSKLCNLNYEDVTTNMNEALEISISTIEATMLFVRQVRQPNEPLEKFETELQA